MGEFEGASFSIDDFSGHARLFPLPNLVLFPHVMQPLHIFEPRYRELIEDSLQGDRLIAMALLSPGWEKDYLGHPPLFPMACLGQITTYHQLEDGTYNALLLGLRRVRVTREVDTAQLFRTAEVEVCEDYYPPHQPESSHRLRRQLQDMFLQNIPALPEAREQVHQMFESDVSLGVLTDVLGYIMDIHPRAKESLLAELNVYRRAEMILDHLVAGSVDNRASSLTPFPPVFSAN